MRCATKVLWLVMAFTMAMPVGFVAAQTSTGDPTGNSPQVPQPTQSGVNWTGVGIGAGTIAGNILYVPAKLVYGILGGIGGGAGYVLTGGNKQVADTIWRSSLGGDYVLTPDMVAGKQPINFSGPTQTAVPAPAPSYSSSRNSSTASTSSYSSYGAASAKPGAVAPIDSGAGPVKTSSATSYPTTSSYPVTSAGSSSYPSASYPTGSAAASSYPVSASRASTSTMSETPIVPSRKSSATSSSSTAIE